MIFFKLLRPLTVDIRFWIYSVIFMCVGIAVTFLPSQVKEEIGTFYDAHVHPKVVLALQEQFGSQPATSPTNEPDLTALNAGSNAALVNHLADQIRKFCCPAAEETFWEVAQRGQPAEILNAIWPAAVVGFCLSTFLVLTSPGATPIRAGIRQPPNVVPARLSTAAAIPGSGTISPATVASLILRARQYRIAVRYAVLSAAVTSLLPPTPGAGSSNWHGIALIGSAFIFGIWSVAAFARWKLSALELAMRLTFMGIFMAGVIALAIALPYRTLNPAAQAPLSREATLWIVTYRLLVIPFVASIGAWVAVLAIRWRVGDPIHALKSGNSGVDSVAN